jgi:hypothetical protein
MDASFLRFGLGFVSPETPALEAGNPVAKTASEAKVRVFFAQMAVRISY